MCGEATAYLSPTRTLNLPISAMAKSARQGDYVFDSICLFVCLFVCLSVFPLATLLKKLCKGLRVAVKFYGGVRSRTKNKYLNFGGNPDDDLAFAEDSAF